MHQLFFVLLSHALHLGCCKENSISLSQYLLKYYCLNNAKILKKIFEVFSFTLLLESVLSVYVQSGACLYKQMSYAEANIFFFQIYLVLIHLLMELKESKEGNQLRNVCLCSRHNHNSQHNI